MVRYVPDPYTREATTSKKRKSAESRRALPTENDPHPHSHFHHLLMLRNHHFRLGSNSSQSFSKRQGLGLLAMNNGDFLDITGNAFDIASQFVFICMTGERIQ